MVTEAERFRTEAEALLLTCSKIELHDWKVNPFTRALVCHLKAEIAWLQEAWSNGAFIDEDNQDKTLQKTIINSGRAEAFQDILSQIADLKLKEESVDD